MDAIVYDKVGKEAEKVRNALYGIYPKETITDVAIASFADGADGIPVEKLVANIELVQDLHGYDHPWPAGGGENLLDYQNFLQRSGYTNITMTDNNGLLTFSGRTEGGRFIAFVAKVTSGEEYTIKCQSNSTGDSPYMFFSDTAPTDAPIYTGSKRELIEPWTITATGSYLIVAFELMSYQSAWSINKLQVVKGGSATDATWTPYSNICPISGLDEVAVKRIGKNLVPFDESYEVVADSTWVNLNCFLKAGTYVFTYNSSVTTGAITFNCFDKDGERIFTHPGIANKDHLLTFTIEKDCYRVRSYSNSSLAISEPMIRLASDTDDAYEPYQEQIVETSLPEIVYGGTLDLETGELVADRGYISDLGSLNWIKEEVQFYSDVISPSSGWNYSVVCSSYPQDLRTGDVIKTPHIRGFAPNGRIYIVDARYDDTVAFKSSLSGVQLVYELDNPQTIQLTASEVSGILTTLYGTNNIWVNTGNIKKLTYRADLGKYIDSHIITAVANTLNA